MFLKSNLCFAFLALHSHKNDSATVNDTGDTGKRQNADYHDNRLKLVSVTVRHFQRLKVSVGSGAQELTTLSTLLQNG